MKSLSNISSDEVEQSLEKTKYAQAWKYLKRCMIGEAITISLMALWALWNTLFATQKPDVGFSYYLFLLLCGSGFVFTSLYLGFVCPCCGHRFFYRGNKRSLWGRKCINCGLPKWASKPVSPLSDGDRIYISAREWQ